MATLKGPGSPGRGPSLKGQLIVDTYRGAIRVRRWPRKQKRPLHPTTQDHVAWFREANWLAKYVAPPIQNLMKEVTVNTPWYPRDILLMLMAGRAYSIGIEGWRTLYSEGQVSDISQSLDILGDTPGMVLLREGQYWHGVKAPASGYFLVSGPEGQPPVWTTQAAPPFAGARVRRLSPQAVAANTLTVINWQTEDFDTNGLWEIGEPSRITIPEGYSIAELTLNIGNVPATAGQLFAAIRNQVGVDVAASDTDTGGQDSVSLSTGPVNVAGGAWFDCTIFRDNSSTVPDNDATSFSVKLYR